MEKTVTARLARTVRAGLLACAAACEGTGGGPSLPTARIDYVEGAIEPIVAPGQRVLIEGFGFGAARGTGAVRFGALDAGVTDSAWADFSITATVPAAVPIGPVTLTVITAAGRALTAAAHVIPAPAIDPATIAWQRRTDFPRSPVGVALAAAEFPSGAGMAVTLYAAGGAEPLSSGGQTAMVPDSGAYVARALPGGNTTPWVRQRDTSNAERTRVLPLPRAFAAAVVATRHNSRLPGNVLYVIGGINTAGVPQATVLGADVSADSITSRFAFLEPLPAPVAGAIAVVRRGRIYVIGGTDAAGRPQRTAFVGRIGRDGHIDGWYPQPLLPGPRAYGGGVVRDERISAIGGLADSVPPGGGLDPATPRLVTSDTARVSLISGFFTGLWGAGPNLLPEARSQFALLDLGNTVVIVGGMYAGAATNAAETLAAPVSGDTVGPFVAAATNRIGDQMCGTQSAGTLIGPTGVTWREATGTPRAVVLGGIDLATEVRRACVWGF